MLESSRSLSLVSTNQLQTTKDERLWLYCPNCPLKFLSRVRLDNHVQKYHKSTREFRCQFCRSAYKTKSRLWNHALKNHAEKDNTENVQESSMRQVRCQICMKTFTSKLKLKSHLLKYHKKAPNNYSKKETKTSSTGFNAQKSIFHCVELLAISDANKSSMRLWINYSKLQNLIKLFSLLLSVRSNFKVSRKSRKTCRQTKSLV